MSLCKFTYFALTGFSQHVSIFSVNNIKNVKRCRYCVKKFIVKDGLIMQKHLDMTAFKMIIATSSYINSYSEKTTERFQ